MNNTANGRCRRTRSTSAWLLALALGTAAAAASLPNFRQAAELDAIGLRLRLMSGGRETPLRSLSIYPYRVSDGRTEHQVDLFDPNELWHRAQHAGAWKHADGTTLTLAVIRSPLPRGFERRHVTPAEFETQQRLTPAPDAWSPERIADWVRDFSGTAPVNFDPLPNPPFRLRDALRFRFPAASPARIAYAFRLNPSAIGQRHADATVFYCEFILPADTNPDEADTEIQRNFLHYVTATEGSAAPESRPASSRFQDRRHEPAPDRSDAYERSRRDVALSIANMADWWYVETAHYLILSNMRASHRTTLKALQQDLERLWITFEALIPPVRPLSAVAVVRIFATPEGYADYVGPEHEWTGGVWMPQVKELVIRPLAERASPQQRERILRTGYHESFHQYIHHALDQSLPPAWYNEGHAVLFEYAEFTSRGVLLGEPDTLVRKLQQIFADNEPRLPELLGLAYETFYDADAERRARHYALAWGLVYYLHKGAPTARRSPFGALIGDYTQALRQGGTPESAQAAIFTPDLVEALEAELRRFWTSPTLRNKARRYRRFP